MVYKKASMSRTGVTVNRIQHECLSKVYGVLQSVMLCRNYVAILVVVVGGCCQPSCSLNLVVAVDETSNLTSGHLQELPFLEFNSTLFLYRLTHTTTPVEVLTNVLEWVNTKNMTAIIDTTADCRLATLAEMMRIPLIRTSIVTCHDYTNYVISVRPTIEMYTSAAFSYTPYYGSCLAKAVMISEFPPDSSIYPRCYNSTAIPLLTRAMGAWPVEEKEIAQTTKWLRAVDMRSAMLYVTVLGSSNFLVQFKELPVTLPSTLHWIFVATDSISLPSTNFSVGSTIMVHSEDYLQEFSVSWRNVPGINEVESYFLMKALQTAQTLHRELNDTTSYFSEFSGLLSTAVNLSMTLYHVDNNRSLQRIGNWTSYGGLVFEESCASTLRDPSIIRISVVHAPPFIFRFTDENGTTQYKGYSIDILSEIAQRLDFNYRFVEPEDGQFGVRNSNGTWTGVIGDIISGSVDLSIVPLTVTAERDAFVDFTTPFYEFAGIEILIKEISQEQDLLFFVKVFSKPMWGAWFGVLLMTGLLLAAFDHLSPYSDRNSQVARDNKMIFSVKEGLWLVTASFTLAGPEITPRTLSGRMLVAGFWFFCSITMANYTANLAAFLTTSRLSTTITSLPNLATQSAVRYSVVGGTSVQTYFERMASIEDNFYELWKDINSDVFAAGGLDKSELAVWDYPLGDTYVKIWRDIQYYGLLSSSQEGMEKVLAGSFALIDEAPYVQYQLSRHCGLTTIGKQFSTKSYAFALPQGSPLTERVSNVILRLQSETVLEKLKQKWWKEDAVDCTKVDESAGLSFYTLAGVFLLAGVGVAAGFLVCLLEMAWTRLSASRASRAHILTSESSRDDLIQNFDTALDNNGSAQMDAERFEVSHF